MTSSVVLSACWFLSDPIIPEGVANVSETSRKNGKPGAFPEFCNWLHKKGFYVQLSEKRAALKATLSYVGRYALRPPLSEVRIKNYTGDMVTFEYKDYRNFGSKVRHTLKTLEFIKRLIRHIPPLYFNMIRHYGLLGSRRKSEFKATADKLLGRLKGFFQQQNWRERQTQHTGTDPLKCKISQKTMEFVAAHIPNPLSKVRQQLQQGFAKP